MKRILIGILSVIIICFLVLFINDKFFIQETQKEEKVEVKKKIAKEEIINDNGLKKDLEQKIKSLSGFNYCEIKNTKEYYNGCLYSKNEIDVNELSSKYKIYSLVLASKSEKQLEEEVQINGETYVINSKIEENKIKELYQNLYGEISDYNSTSINEIERKSSKAIYNEGQFYLITSSDENIQDNEVITYINKYTIKEDKAYIYVSTAFINMIKDGNGKITNYEVYSDYNMTNLKEEGLYSEYRKETQNKNGEVIITNNFKINDENYKNYDQYKFIFQKDENGNYYFKEIIKIK